MFREATREYRRSARCSKPTTKPPNSTSLMHAGWDSESPSGDHRSPKKISVCISSSCAAKAAATRGRLPKKPTKSRRNQMNIL
ncbi:hypothetical protein KSP40_PGU020872 [Platanthera guangdongensis]|uniref:Uncharacterized protein n=1 Tax=Platanthera guangdongensis TaxID=2320717 RepID=A0ABR2LCT7_9ASPA